MAAPAGRLGGASGPRRSDVNPRPPSLTGPTRGKIGQEPPISLRKWTTASRPSYICDAWATLTPAPTRRRPCRARPVALHPAGAGPAPPQPSSLDLLTAIESRIDVDQGRALARYGGLRLESAFQPIVSLAHGRAVGFEALVRPFAAHQRESLPPTDVFASAAERGESVLLDGVCRTLHLVNFELSRRQDVWVFVNMTPSTILATGAPDPLFALLLDRRGVPPHQVVIEILESKTYDEQRLADVVSYFRELGCVVALDDFGAGQSNFERIWRIAPDLVKLDRSMLEEATREPRVRRILPGLVALLHEAGCLVVMEGIEDEHQALIAMEMDVDFVQGFYFGFPVAKIDPACERLASTMRNLFRIFRQKDGAPDRGVARHAGAVHVCAGSRQRPHP